MLIDKTNSYILTEFTDNMTVSFPEDVKQHLFDLEKNTEDVYINMSVGSSTKKELSEDDDEFVALLLEQIKERVKKPSLDTLLDKINSKGFEQEVLKEITQNLNS
jgi:methionine salvage enolase-phosphatase E1